MNFKCEWQKIPDLISKVESEIKNGIKLGYEFPKLVHHLDNIYSYKYMECFCNTQCKCVNDYKHTKEESDMATIALNVLKQYKKKLREKENIIFEKVNRLENLEHNLKASQS